MKPGSHTINILIILSALFLHLVTGCVNDEGGTDCTGTQAIISLSVRAASDSINEDDVLWEDRVDELRMLAFDSETGELVFNQKLYFPDGFNDPSRAILFPLGTYNFYFIANETVYSNLVNALEDIQNESGFTSNTTFRTLAYNPAFRPDGTTQEGRFVMSAVYKNIVVVAGGTESNPALLALPTEKVELVRSLAKVEVIFRKTVSGSTIPENTITSVLLENVAATLSVPPWDAYYTGTQTTTQTASLAGLDYDRDSIGSVTFYVPEFLVEEGSTGYTLLEINNTLYPIENDEELEGLQEQRRTIPSLSTHSVIRNYHYIVNAYIDGEGGLQIRTYVEPWEVSPYRYLFEGDKQIVLPPIIPTDSSIIIDTECGRVEILSRNENLTSGLMGAYNDEIVYYDNETGEMNFIRKGDPPYYCEKKYGEGWRLINSCELLSFLGVLDTTYTIWLSNTWDATTYNKPYYPLYFRQAAQELLEKLSGIDLSASVLYPTNNWQDVLVDYKLDIVDRYFTPGDILVRPIDFPDGWSYAAPPPERRKTGYTVK
ncbi:MAG: FimB/Mfa2 family fimbrial subunit [Firmicutes bacterium]|nr:FimB/Mfa2 family fimbrial subunit [Bacillota bacterium]